MMVMVMMMMMMIVMMMMCPAHLAAVDGHDGADEVGRDDHAPDVRLDDLRLVQRARLCGEKMTTSSSQIQKIMKTSGQRGRDNGALIKMGEPSQDHALLCVRISKQLPDYPATPRTTPISNKFRHKLITPQYGSSTDAAPSLCSTESFGVASPAAIRHQAHRMMMMMMMMIIKSGIRTGLGLLELPDQRHLLPLGLLVQPPPRPRRELPRAIIVVIIIIIMHNSADTGWAA
jgi:hypothetical protein